MLLLVLSAVLLAASFTLPWLGWLSFVALVPLLVLAERTRWSRRKFMFLLWLAGLGFFLFNLLWLRQPAPGSYPGLEGPLLTAAVNFGWVVMGLIFSLQFIAFGWLLYRIRGRLLTWQGGLIAVVGWGLLEFGRSWLCSIIIWGPGATLGPHWNFGTLGLAASGTPLVYLGRFAGLYGLGMAAAAINLALLHLYHRRWRWFAAILLPLVILAAIAAQLYPANGKEFKIGLIQLGRHADINYGEPLKQLLAERNLQAGADLLVLPEYSNFYTSALTADRPQILSRFFAADKGMVVMAGAEYAGESKYNQVIFFDRQGQMVSVQNKQFIVNGGEVMPQLINWLLHAAGQGQMVDTFNANQARRQGDRPEEPVAVNGVQVGSLACSGVIAPELYRDITNRGAEVLTNSAATGIFANTNSFYRQVEQMSRFHAAANARPFAQAAKGGYSFVLDSNGNTLYRAGHNGLDFAVTSVTASSSKTPYTQYGEWLVPVGCLIIIGIVLTSRYKADGPAGRE